MTAAVAEQTATRSPGSRSLNICRIAGFCILNMPSAPACPRSRQEVADQIGTTLETASKTERGTSAPSVEVFLAMVRVLQLEIDDLISDDDSVARSTASTKRARLQAEVTTTARAMVRNPVQSGHRLRSKADTRMVIADSR
jgi:transcriptional regulator with XRE-family HTH domain